MEAPRRLLAILLAALTLGLLPTAASAATPQDARGFVDTIGVNTHLHYTGTPYYNFPMLKQRLKELGVRHVRDGIAPGRQDSYDRFNDLAASGIKSTVIGCDFPNRYDWRIFVDEIKNKLRGSLDAVEGVNEPDLNEGGQHDDGAWYNDARGCNYWLTQLLKGTHSTEYGPPYDLPVFGPSVVPDGRAQALGNLLSPPHADGGNLHPYPGSQKPSGPDYLPLAEQMQRIRTWNFEGRHVPVISTETGYHDYLPQTDGHLPVSQRAAGIYMPRLFLEYARAGVQRTFAYELVNLNVYSGANEYADHFGLFNSDWSYKPSATALKNTIGFLDSPSAGPRTPLDYKLSNTGDPDGAGPGGPVKDSLFQKADGSWWLALWQDSTVWNTETKQDISNASVIVDVQLDRTVTVTGYRPTKGTGTYGSLAGVSSFRAGVSDDVLLLKLAP